MVFKLGSRQLCCLKIRKTKFSRKKEREKKKKSKKIGRDSEGVRAIRARTKEGTGFRTAVREERWNKN